MEDERIVELYWKRDEAAISESSQKYGTYCLSIAQNILFNLTDAEGSAESIPLRRFAVFSHQNFVSKPPIHQV